jgi:hypothetical protein
MRGKNLHSVTTLQDVLAILHAAGKVDDDTRDRTLKFLSDNQVGRCCCATASNALDCARTQSIYSKLLFSLLCTLFCALGECALIRMVIIAKELLILCSHSRAILLDVALTAAWCDDRLWWRRTRRARTARANQRLRTPCRPNTRLEREQKFR